MPSTSKKQHNLMAAAAHNPAFAKKAGVPTKVAKEFVAADKGKSFKEGGQMKSEKAKELRHAKTLEKVAKEERAEAAKMKKGGTAKCMAKGGLAAGHKAADGIAKKGKTKATEVKMCGGGRAKGK